MLMKPIKYSMKNSFLPFSTFIEYQKQLKELKSTLRLKKSSISEACKIFDAYIKPQQKLSRDIMKMRKE